MSVASGYSVRAHASASVTMSSSVMLLSCPLEESPKHLRALRAALKVGRGGAVDRGKGSESDSLSTSDTTDYLLQRLHDQAPELYAEVAAAA